MIADMEVRLNAARLLTYDAAYQIDQHEDSAKAASIAKYYAAETAKDVVDTCLQLHGGYGYSQEYGIEKLYRDIRVNTIYEGSSQAQQKVIAGQVLKQHPQLFGLTIHFKEEIHMSYAFFNEDHESIREMARDFAERALMPVAAEVDKTGVFPQDLVDEMANMGFFGIKIPEEYGGMGLDARTYVCVMEEIARGSAVATAYLSGANSLASAPIILAGTEEQKQKYLPGIADNTGDVAFALTEPNAGSDAGGMTTKAVEDGDYYILDGRKTFITGAPLAKYCVVFAKTSPSKGSKGITAFIVDMATPGVSVGKHEEKMGQLGLDCCDVVLEDVRVPKSDILGQVDLGFVTAMKTLSVGRCGVAAQGIGIAQAAIDCAAKHMKERKQFGKPLAAFQGLQFMLAEMETKLNAARLLVYQAAYQLDMGEDATKAASMAKYYATEVAVDIVGKALQIHGGYGYSKEYTIERLYRDVRVLTLYEGTTQVQQMVIAGQLLK